MSHRVIRQAIVSILESIPDIGAVQPYERFARGAEAMRAMYQVDGQLRGWFVRRVKMAETYPTLFGDTAHQISTWHIVGIMALADDLGSELLMDDWVDRITARFGADPTLAGNVEGWAGDTDGVELLDSSPVDFSGVMCHRVILSLQVLSLRDVPVEL